MKSSAYITIRVFINNVLYLGQKPSCARQRGGINLGWFTAGGSTQLLLHTLLVSSYFTNALSCSLPLCFSLSPSPLHYQMLTIPCSLHLFLFPLHFLFSLLHCALLGLKFASHISKVFPGLVYQQII